MHFLDNILVRLRAKPLVAGLEISDSGIRFAYFDGKRWQLVGMRIPPGILEGGKIKDTPQFMELLKKLRVQARGAVKRRRKITVAVSLSSVNVYTQVFSLPILEGENFEKAVELNLQMVSPENVAETYAGWQTLSGDKAAFKAEVLSAFIHRSIVDDIQKALGDAGFFVLSIESRALALGRLVRSLGTGLDPNKPFALLHLDNDALDFVVIRGGRIYFDYFTFWVDLNAEGKHIKFSDFEAAITRNLHQMVTFYNQHWQDQLEDIFVVTLGLKDEVAKIIKDNFSFQIKELQLNLNQPVGPEWFVALGAGLRALVPRRDDLDISLTQIGTQEAFRREQFATFFAFWRIAVPVVLGIFLAALFGAQWYLAKAGRSLVLQVPKIDEETARAVNDLEAQAKSFNRAVSQIQTLRASREPQYPIFERILKYTQDAGVTLTQFNFQGLGAATAMSGEAAADENIRTLKRALETDPSFADVRLPVTAIRKIGQTFSFKMDFVVTSLNTSSSKP